MVFENQTYLLSLVLRTNNTNIYGLSGKLFLECKKLSKCHFSYNKNRICIHEKYSNTWFLHFNFLKLNDRPSGPWPSRKLPFECQKIAKELQFFPNIASCKKMTFFSFKNKKKFWAIFWHLNGIFRRVSLRLSLKS